jgi:hypothetical protein
MPTTPNPSDSQLREARFVASPNVAASLDELVARLRANLPREIALMNADYGWSGPEQIVAVPAKNIQRTAATPGAGPNALIANSLLVGLTVESESIAPVTSKDKIAVSLYDVHGRVSIEQQWKPIERRLCAIRSVLYHFLVDCYDDEGRLCWKQLSFQNAVRLPKPYENFAGFELRYQMTITPDAAQWAI